MLIDAGRPEGGTGNPTPSDKERRSLRLDAEGSMREAPIPYHRLTGIFRPPNRTGAWQTSQNTPSTSLGEYSGFEWM